MANNRYFQLAILDESLNSRPPGLGQDLQTSWPLLQKAYPSQIIYSVTEDDIENYKWSEQVIVLTPDASDAILDKLGNCRKDFKRNVECLINLPFIVVYEDIPIYGGIFFTNLPVATAVNYPVIYPSFDNNSVIFTIRPYQSLFNSYSDTDWSKIKDEKIKATFTKLEKLGK